MNNILLIIPVFLPIILGIISFLIPFKKQEHLNIFIGISLVLSSIVFKQGPYRRAGVAFVHADSDNKLPLGEMVCQEMSGAGSFCADILKAKILLHVISGTHFYKMP